VRKLERTQQQLGLLAQREAHLQVALQLQGLTESAQLLRAQELLADLSTPEQPPPPPEPQWPAPEPMQPELPPVPAMDLPVMHRPEPEEELEPMLPAEDQLFQRLGSPSTLPSFRSSES
jgi:hypothetical protein